ncbi:MAG TPA: glycosyltransferase [Candidatus Acidoferrales bacterium]|nr:glycosyltransferase [Candidatus Acidoferrales bacterium]
MSDTINGKFDAAVQRARAALANVDELQADLERLKASRFYRLHAALARPANDAALAAPETFDPAALETLRDLWLRRVAERPLSSEPIVSIVIPAYNHVALTVRCLTSIARSWFETLHVEIIIADDGSKDETALLAEALPGLIVIANRRNEGFISACNRGASIARGKYLCFLNNDASACDGWLDELVTTAESDGSIAIVGSKLLYPNGKLQEAGGIVYRDGSAANYGRGDNPDDPRYNYVRDVDYCSGASLLVRAEVFRSLGAFDTRYAPAYYEDSDLCFAARAAGYRVVYQPRSRVVHDEGATSGTSMTRGVKRYQTVNRLKFVERWRDTLTGQQPPGKTVEGARRIRRGQVVLVVDSYVPLHDRESGSKRLLALLKIMREQGLHVIFLPDNYAAIQPYASELEALGIEVLYHVDGGRSKEAAIDEVLPILDFAWICRPELFEIYYPNLRRNHATKFIYDTIDLHFVREQREETRGALPATGSWQATQARELSAARRADTVLTVTHAERDVLRGFGITSVHVVPNVHEPVRVEGLPFEQRLGVLFIGGYNHRPNVDAARYLCEEIMPRVWETLPDVRVTLLGSNPTESVLALAGDRVEVPGYVPDVTPFFTTRRVFAAPLRYGAGLKGKIGESLAYGLPVVTTEIGAEGFSFEDGRHYLHAEEPAAFAAAIVRLYTDARLWNRVAEAAGEALEPLLPARVAEAVRDVLR